MCWKSPESAAAFRQIYVDYELLPPFQQLERGSYHLADNERNVHELSRWDGRLCQLVALSGWNAEAGNVWKKAAASMRCANLPLMALSNLKQNIFH